MASAYVNTILQDALVKASQEDAFQSFEARGSNYGALDAAVKGVSKMLTPRQLSNLKQSSAQATKIDLLVKEAEGSGTVRKCTGSGDGSSYRATLSWSTIAEEFSISELDMHQNNYSYEEMFAFRFRQKLLSIYSRLDSAVVAALEANYTAGNGTSFTFYNNASQVPLSNWDLNSGRSAMWVNKLKSDMFANDLMQENLHITGDANLMSVMSAMLNQGTGTHTNLGFQFQGIDSTFTNRITNNNGIYATGYVHEIGQIGILTWANMLARKGADIGTDKWYTFSDPRYGFTMEIKEKAACTDTSSSPGITGGQADLLHSYVISFDYAIPVAYSSDSNSGIYKYELDENETVLSGSGSY